MPLEHTKPTSEDESQAPPLFARFARWVEWQVGRSSTFVLAIAIVVLWAVSGPVFGWSDTWQLVIKHRDDNRHLSDGVRDPKHSKSRYASDAVETGRANPRE